MDFVRCFLIGCRQRLSTPIFLRCLMVLGCLVLLSWRLASQPYKIDYTDTQVMSDGFMLGDMRDCYFLLFFFLVWWGFLGSITGGWYGSSLKGLGGRGLGKLKVLFMQFLKLNRLPLLFIFCFPVGFLASSSRRGSITQTNFWEWFLSLAGIFLFCFVSFVLSRIGRWFKGKPGMGQIGSPRQSAAAYSVLSLVALPLVLAILFGWGLDAIDPWIPARERSVLLQPFWQKFIVLLWPLLALGLPLFLLVRKVMSSEMRYFCFFCWWISLMPVHQALTSLLFAGTWGGSIDVSCAGGEVLLGHFERFEQIMPLGSLVALMWLLAMAAYMKCVSATNPQYGAAFKGMIVSYFAIVVVSSVCILIGLEVRGYIAGSTSIVLLVVRDIAVIQGIRIDTNKGLGEYVVDYFLVAYLALPILLSLFNRGIWAYPFSPVFFANGQSDDEMIAALLVKCFMALVAVLWLQRVQKQIEMPVKFQNGEPNSV
jgi:hypothetical protein